MNPHELTHAIRMARDQAMEKIMKMDDKSFLWALLSDTLPEFDRPEEGDDDYQRLFRATNHIGVDQALVHRSFLRNLTTQEYALGYLWGYDAEEERERHIRDLAMSLILEMPVSEWVSKFEDGNVPLFVRAKPGDEDYFEPEVCIENTEKFIDTIRPALRMLEYEYVRFLLDKNNNDQTETY